jgi:hypothetical protein
LNIREKVASVKAAVSMARFLNDHGDYHLVPDVAQQIRCFGHDDRTPSARFYPDTNAVYCWTCGKLFDVVTACQLLLNKDFPDAAEYLCTRYRVEVQAQPQQIQHFYGQVARFVGGDTKTLYAAVKQFGDDFRIHYQRIPGWKFLHEVLDYLWQQYDEIYATADTPKCMFDRTLEWYQNACALVDSYKDQCTAVAQLQQKESPE